MILLRVLLSIRQNQSWFKLNRRKWKEMKINLGSLEMEKGRIRKTDDLRGGSFFHCTIKK